MRTRTLVKFSLVLYCSIFAIPTATAGFATYSRDWPQDASVVTDNEDVDDDANYDDDDNSSATVADNNNPDKTIVTVSNDADDDNNAYADGKTPDQGRLYVKLGGNYNTEKIRAIRNYSSGVLSSRTVKTTGTDTSGLSWEVGVGTKIKYVRYELEYVNTKNINYDPSPIFTTGLETLTSVVKTNSLLLNAIYDFDNIDMIQTSYVKPYVGILGGITWNRTRNTMTKGIGDGVARNGNQITGAWGITFGVRMPLFSRFTGYFGYRYARQGIVMWKDDSSTMQLKGKSILYGFNFGISYLL